MEVFRLIIHTSRHPTGTSRRLYRDPGVLTFPEPNKRHFHRKIAHPCYDRELLLLIIYENLPKPNLPKICELRVSVMIQNYIVRFQISENDISFVQVLKSKNYLGYINSNLVFRKSRNKY